MVVFLAYLVVWDLGWWSDDNFFFYLASYLVVCAFLSGKGMVLVMVN